MGPRRLINFAGLGNFAIFVDYSRYMIRLYIFCVFFVVCNVVCAATLEVSPGRLCELMDGSGDLDELILTGTADASDFYFMAESMPALRPPDRGCLLTIPLLGHAFGGCRTV